MPVDKFGRMIKKVEMMLESMWIKNAYIKREVDDFTKLLDHVKKTIDERPHIIAVHANYTTQNLLRITFF